MFCKSLGFRVYPEMNPEMLDLLAVYDVYRPISQCTLFGEDWWHSASHQDQTVIDLGALCAGFIVHT